VYQCIEILHRASGLLGHVPGGDAGPATLKLEHVLPRLDSVRGAIARSVHLRQALAMARFGPEDAAGRPNGRHAPLGIVHEN